MHVSRRLFRCRGYADYKHEVALHKGQVLPGSRPLRCIVCAAPHHHTTYSYFQLGAPPQAHNLHCPAEACSGVNNNILRLASGGGSQLTCTMSSNGWCAQMQIIEDGGARQMRRAPVG